MTESKWLMLSILDARILFLTLCCSSQQESQNNYKLFVDIYYSAMDPKSAEFLRTQLNAVANSVLAKYIDVSLLPFATCKKVKDSRKISCGMGQEEEYANLHHICAYHYLNEIKSPTSELSLNLKAITYIVCTVNRTTETFRQIDFKGCSDYLKEVTDSVEKCVKNEDDLFSDAWEKLQGINATAYPAIAFDGSYDAQVSNRAGNFLWEEMCRKMGYFAPLECQNITDPITTCTIVNATATFPGVSLLGFPFSLIVLVLEQIPQDYPFV